MKSFYLLSPDESFIIDRWRELPQEERTRVYLIMLQGITKTDGTAVSNELDRAAAEILLDYHNHQ